MPTENEIVKLESCSQFPVCSINKCPLDHEAEHRVECAGENKCPFTTKRRIKSQRGIKLLAVSDILKVIPESNLKMLNKGNQRRWHVLHQKAQFLVE